ncbi:DUF4153 domain-containing protein [Acetobacterium paludosum]|nr:DUF4153 domain-containing protein [Acetobacterium paludosum]
MKIIDKFSEKLSGLYRAISRYPMTVLFLLSAAVVNAIAISQDADYYRFLLTFAVGACLGFTLQAAWERFFDKIVYRLVMMGIGLILTIGYFLIVSQYTSTGWETSIRTSVAVFALAIAYVWVPVIKSTVTFNESFMAAFKAVFNSLLFSGVIFLGITLIITAIDLLLFRVPEKAYLQSLSIIMILFAPIYFLSLIPVYPGASDKIRSAEELEQQKEKIIKACACPKFVEVLISYIIIPLLAVYTVILVIYIAINITGKFWTDNRLEPMLVGFAIATILICILASRMENKFAELFRKTFPKILVPIVLFQIASSVLKTSDTGLTCGRYYVILFGIFAAASGILMSFLPVRKNGVIAALLIGLSMISIIPPIDAFTGSRINQEAMLRDVLIQNNMLQNDQIIPNASLSEEDKQVISNSMNYLVMMEYTNGISYLGKDYDPNEDFYHIFGFYQYEQNMYGKSSIYLALDQQSPISISDYDIFVMVSFYFQDDKEGPKVCDFEKAGKTYTLLKDTSTHPGTLRLSDEDGQELISVNLQDVFNYFDTTNGASNQINKGFLSVDQATVTQENDKVVFSLVAVNVNIDKSSMEQPYSGDFYVLIKIK